MRRTRPFVIIAALVLMAGCRHPSSGSDVKAETQSRYVLGVPQDVPIQGFDADRLRQDPSLARQSAWTLFLLVNQPVELRDPRTGDAMLDPDGKVLALPLWQTWYTMDEFRSLFGQLLARQHGIIPVVAPEPSDVEQVLREHSASALDDPFWTDVGPAGSRLDRFIDGLDTVHDGRALGGVGHGQTLFSPALVRHVLLHFLDVAKCAQNPVAPIEPAFGSCLGGPFPANAIAVKANWIKIPDPVPTYDTSATALTKILSGQSPDWAPSGIVDAPTTAYTAGKIQNLKKLGTYRLVGLSVTSKEIPDWLWTTYFWSPEPNSDFGVDNPVRTPDPTSPTVVSVATSFAEFANYKMCVVVDYKDSTGAPSWCSNPYIEAQPGGANSNCIGCHQHAGPDRGDFEVSVGKEKERETFPADYLWSFDAFKESFKDEVVRVLNEAQ